MAFVKVYTTQSGDLSSPLTTPVIVDMDFPINITGFTQAGGVGTNHTVADIKCTDLPAGMADLQIDFVPASGTVADRLTEDQLVNSLNNIMGEAVAAPYAIPDYKQASRSGEYLEPDTRYVIADIMYIA